MFGLGKISDWFDGVADGWQGGAKWMFWIGGIAAFVFGLSQGMDILGAAGMGLAGAMVGAVGGGVLGAGINALRGPDFDSEGVEAQPEVEPQVEPEKGLKVDPPGPTPPAPVVKTAGRSQE